MHLKHLKIANYKSFFEARDFNFEPGFNVLLGANSSGKTSVLEAIAFNEFGDRPHISVLNSSEPGHIPNNRPLVELVFEATPEEVQRLVSPEVHFFLGLGVEQGHFYSQDPELVAHRLANDPLHIGLLRDLSKDVQFRIGFENWPPKWRNLSPHSELAPGAHNDGNRPIDINNFQASHNDLQKIWQKLPVKIYRSYSERVEIGRAHV